MNEAKSIVLAGVWPDQKLVICKTTNEDTKPALRVTLLGDSNWLIEQKQGDDWVQLFIIPEPFVKYYQN